MDVRMHLHDECMLVWMLVLCSIACLQTACKSFHRSCSQHACNHLGSIIKPIDKQCLLF